MHRGEKTVLYGFPYGEWSRTVEKTVQRGTALNRTVGYITASNRTVGFSISENRTVYGRITVNNPANFAPDGDGSVSSPVLTPFAIWSCRSLVPFALFAQFVRTGAIRASLFCFGRYTCALCPKRSTAQAENAT